MGIGFGASEYLSYLYGVLAQMYEVSSSSGELTATTLSVPAPSVQSSGDVTAATWMATVGN